MSDDLRDALEKKVKTLVESCWYRRINWIQVESWLENFTGITGDVDKERLHALYFLACFLYYGNPEIRELLRAVYRDHFQYPLFEAIRRRNGDTRDLSFIQSEFEAELKATRFVGVGNPSESGAQLDRNSARVDKKYQLNCMLAPKWGLPIARRGTIKISTELVNSIFDDSQAQQFQKAMKLRIQEMQAPHFGRDKSAHSTVALDLFDEPPVSD